MFVKQGQTKLHVSNLMGRNCESPSATFIPQATLVVELPRLFMHLACHGGSIPSHICVAPSKSGFFTPLYTHSWVQPLESWDSDSYPRVSHVT